jgi:hypothetical protein
MSENGENAKAALFAELSADQVNVLRVRALCRSHPGMSIIRILFILHFAYVVF